jgi:hypothetical protein
VGQSWNPYFEMHKCRCNERSISPKLTLRIAKITGLTSKRVRDGRFTSSIGVGMIQIQGKLYHRSCCGFTPDWSDNIGHLEGWPDWKNNRSANRSAVNERAAQGNLSQFNGLDFLLPWFGTRKSTHTSMRLNPGEEKERQSSPTAAKERARTKCGILVLHRD